MLTTKYKLPTIIVSLSLIISFVLISFESLAKEDLEDICQLEKLDNQCQILPQQECQSLLEKCKSYYEQKTFELEKDISVTQKKEKNYANQVYILNSKIRKLRNQIYQSNLIVKDLGIQIEDTGLSIVNTSLKIDDSKEKLIVILRTIYEEDQKSIIEILLSEEKLSDFFNNLMTLEVLNSKNQELLQEIKKLKLYLEDQKQSLGGEKDDLKRQVLIQRLQQGESEKTKQEKEYVLEQTRGEKVLYEEYLKDIKEKSREIRKRIFRLVQIPESEAPSLEEAYELAKYVETVTGVRPAFLLGLLQIESRIGQNVGQCNCSSCRYPDIDWKTVMSKRHWDSFLKITKELGMDANQTPVSCWIGGGKIQMGGAMGPAQFMPNTWLYPQNVERGYKRRVEQISGRSPANPWRVSDAFLASGLYLSDRGARSQKLYDEIGAATAYLCGTTRMTSRCIAAGVKLYIYGWTDRNGNHHKGIMDYAAEFQEYVDRGVFENNN
ncbi:MAG: lytic murein transglycosylase [Patescibacteria group bacterium]|nr:lytic murein transglycosylase [Patescibacteria group bacterium]